MAPVVPLVAFVNGQYQLHEPSMEWLASQEEDFAVMACAGKFRTGKSFLLNRFTKCEPGLGFGVGETIQACTRGIWMHKDFLRQDGGTPLLVLDTEGIDALDAENEHDVRIFALSVLISSIFVYNSMSHLDEAAVQTLSLMTKVTQALGEETHSPTLYWVLRDFALQLVDAGGQPITHSQYLDQALDCPTTQSKCVTREAIKQVFKKRHLVTLPRPHRGERIQKLEHQPLNNKFEKCLATFRDHVCKNARPFSASGVPLAGKLYVDFLRSIVLKVNTDHCVPKIEDAWTLLSRVQHVDKEDEARRALTKTALEECDPDVEDKVLSYVKGLCSQHCKSIVFMPPLPNIESMTDRLTKEVFNHCKTFGKILTMDKVASGLVENFLLKIGPANIAHDPSVLMDIYNMHFPDEGTKLKALQVFVKVMIESATLQDSFALVEAKGEDKHRLELEETKLKLRHTEESLADSSRRSWNMEAYTEAKREDACTQTDMTSEDSIGAADISMETEKKIVELESQLSASQVKLSVAEEKNKTHESRTKQMQSIYEENIEEIRSQTIERLESAQRQKETALKEAKQCAEHKKVLKEECERLHHSLKEAQEHTVDMHRSTLEELRRRDSEGRDLAEKQRMEWSKLRVQAETTSQENRCLKRRMDECLEIEQESKRLRNSYKQLEVEYARNEALKEVTQGQLQALRDENEALTRKVSELESRLAVSEATSKLDACRRSLL